METGGPDPVRDEEDFVCVEVFSNVPDVLHITGHGAPACITTSSVPVQVAF